MTWVKVGFPSSFKYLREERTYFPGTSYRKALIFSLCQWIGKFAMVVIIFCEGKWGPNYRYFCSIHRVIRFSVHQGRQRAAQAFGNVRGAPDNGDTKILLFTRISNPQLLNLISAGSFSIAALAGSTRRFQYRWLRHCFWRRGQLLTTGFLCLAPSNV